MFYVCDESFHGRGCEGYESCAAIVCRPSGALRADNYFDVLDGVDVKNTTTQKKNVYTESENGNDFFYCFISYLRLI